MALAQLERRSALDDLDHALERGGERLRDRIDDVAGAAGSAAAQAEDAVTGLGAQAEEIGSDLRAEVGRFADTTNRRSTLAVFLAVALAIALSGLIVLARRRARSVRMRSAARAHD